MDDCPLVASKSKLQLCHEARDSMRLNHLEVSCTYFKLVNVRPQNATQFELKNRTFTFKLKLGVHELGSLEVAIQDGVLTSSTSAKCVLDCMHNNDLVDYFKTMFEGALEVQLDEFDATARI